MDVLFEILRVARLVESGLSLDFGAIRLSPLHAQLLVVLWRDGPSSFRRLLHRLGCADSTLSSALRALEDRGCLRRVRDPGRRTTVHFALTLPGRQLASIAWDSMAVLDWRLAAVAEDGAGDAIQRLFDAADAALRDGRGRVAHRARSHRRREDPLLE